MPVSGASGELRVDLEAGPPATLPAGTTTAAFCFGTCFHRRASVTALELLVGGSPQPVTAFGMPRRDLFEALHPQVPMGRGPIPSSDPDSEEDPEVRCYRSGFWATVTIEAGSAGEVVELALRARLDDGGEATAAIAAIEIAAPEAAPSHPGVATTEAGKELIAVCMSTYNPDIELFRRQVESLRAQTDTSWVCGGQRRPLASRELSRDRGRCSPATSASCSRDPRAGSASTATSSAPWASPRPRPP